MDMDERREQNVCLMFSCQSLWTLREKQIKHVRGLWGRGKGKSFEKQNAIQEQMLAGIVCRRDVTEAVWDNNSHGFQDSLLLESLAGGSTLFLLF